MYSPKEYLTLLSFTYKNAAEQKHQSYMPKILTKRAK